MGNCSVLRRSGGVTEAVAWFCRQSCVHAHIECLVQIGHACVHACSICACMCLYHRLTEGQQQPHAPTPCCAALPHFVLILHCAMLCCVMLCRAVLSHAVQFEWVQPSRPHRGGLGATQGVSSSSSSSSRGWQEQWQRRGALLQDIFRDHQCYVC
jgi:hypothetical protein